MESWGRQTQRVEFDGTLTMNQLWRSFRALCLINQLFGSRNSEEFPRSLLIQDYIISTEV